MFLQKVFNHNALYSKTQVRESKEWEEDYVSKDIFFLEMRGDFFKLLFYLLIFLFCDREAIFSASRILMKFLSEFWPEEPDGFRILLKFKNSDATDQKTPMALKFLRNSSRISIPSASLSMNPDVVDLFRPVHVLLSRFYLDFILISKWVSKKSG